MCVCCVLMVLTQSSRASPPPVSVLCGSLSHIPGLYFVCIPLGLARPPGWPWGWICPGAGRLSSWYTARAMAHFPRVTWMSLGSQPTTSTVAWKLFREKAGMIQNLPCFLYYCPVFEYRCFVLFFFNLFQCIGTRMEAKPRTLTDSIWWRRGFPPSLSYPTPRLLSPCLHSLLCSSLLLFLTVPKEMYRFVPFLV